MAVVVAKQPPESIAAVDGSMDGELGKFRVNDLVLQALMVALVVIMEHELGDSAAQGGVTEEDQLIQTLFLDRAHEALGEGVEIRGPRRQTQRLDAGASENCPELLVVEPGTFAQLLLEHADFFLKVCDDCLLVTVHPTGKADQKKGQGTHGEILPSTDSFDELFLGGEPLNTSRKHPNHKALNRVRVFGQYGILIPLANYTAEPIGQLVLKVNVPRSIARVESARHGNITFRQTSSQTVELSLPLENNDFVKLYCK